MCTLQNDNKLFSTWAGKPGNDSGNSLHSGRMTMLNNSSTSYLRSPASNPPSIPIHKLWNNSKNYSKALLSIIKSRAIAMMFHKHQLMSECAKDFPDQDQFTKHNRPKKAKCKKNMKSYTFNAMRKSWRTSKLCRITRAHIENNSCRYSIQKMLQMYRVSIWLFYELIKWIFAWNSKQLGVASVFTNC